MVYEGVLIKREIINKRNIQRVKDKINKIILSSSLFFSKLR